MFVRRSTRVCATQSHPDHHDSWMSAFKLRMFHCDLFFLRCSFCCRCCLGTGELPWSVRLVYGMGSTSR